MYTWHYLILKKWYYRYVGSDGTFNNVFFRTNDMTILLWGDPMWWPYIVMVDSRNLWDPYEPVRRYCADVLTYNPPAVYRNILRLYYYTDSAWVHISKNRPTGLILDFIKIILLLWRSMIFSGSVSGSVFAVTY